jgi:hypothetical protein
MKNKLLLELELEDLKIGVSISVFVNLAIMFFGSIYLSGLESLVMKSLFVKVWIPLIFLSATITGVLCLLENEKHKEVDKAHY